METRVKRNGETVLEILHENEKLRERIAELEASNARLGKLASKFETIGKIIDGFFLKQYVGEGEFENGKKFELDVMNDYSPSVYYNGKTYVLPWKDIVELAELAGLFKSEVTE